MRRTVYPLHLPGEDPELTLSQIPKHHRLNEWAFELPIAGGLDHRRFGKGGSQHRGELTREDALIEALSLGRTSPLINDAYLESLNKLSFQRLAGFLVGSIDLVFATQEDGQPKRFYLADYKSNRLDLRRERRHMRSHFHPDWMRDEMPYHHYVLQSHLYALALHRYLRLRLGAVIRMTNILVALFICSYVEWWAWILRAVRVAQCMV